MNILPFYIVCGYIAEYYCKFPWQRIFSIFNMEFENGYYDQEGFHE